MVDENLLIIKVNVMLRGDKLQEIRELIMKQKETGLIILPPFCEAVVVPKDTEIKIKERKINHDN